MAITQPCWQYFLKLSILIVFLSSDLALNSTSEYKEFADQDDAGKEYVELKLRSNKIHLLTCTLQMLSQLSSFTVVFSLFCDTFPFQIGLIGLLTKQFSTMLSLQFVYFGLTIIVASLRLVNLYDGMTMHELWETNYYTFISFTQKLGECREESI